MDIQSLFYLFCCFAVFVGSVHASHKPSHKEEKGTATTDSTMSTTYSTSSSSSLSSTSTSTTATTTATTETETTTTAATTIVTTPEAEGCSTKDDLSNHCTLPKVLNGINFWDVYHVIFSNDVLKALLVSCSSGHWCLKDKFDFWDALLMERAGMVKKSDLFNAVCGQEARTCLKQFAGNFTKCRNFATMNFTLDTVDLLCRLKINTDLSMECLQHVLAGIHVTTMDILRDDNHKQTVEAGFNDTPCKNPESQMTRTYRCIDTKCPGDEKYFASFPPWKWFIHDVAQISKDCGFKTGICADDTHFGEQTATATTTYATTTLFEDIFGHAEIQGDNEKGTGVQSYAKSTSMIVGLTVTSAVMVAIFLLIMSLVWRRSIRKRSAKGDYSPLNDDRVTKGGYSPLMNDVTRKGGYSPLMNDD